MNPIKKYFYMSIGFLCVGLAYIGIVTPGIPFSIFLVIAAWAFAKSSPRMEKWLYNHPWFGKFLTNWNKKRVFPTKGKYLMAAMLGIFAVTMTIQFAGYFLKGVADFYGVPDKRQQEADSIATG